MAVSEYRLLNRTDRRAVADALRVVVRRWQDEWWPGDGGVEIDARAYPDTLVPAAYRWFGAIVHETGAYVGIAEGATNAFACALAGHPTIAAEATGGSTASDLVRASVEALVIGILRGNGRGDDPRGIRWERSGPAPGEGAHTQGWIVARCKLDNTEFVLVLNPAAGRNYLAPALKRRNRQLGDIFPLRTALAQKPVVLRVYAGAAELSLPELGMLSAGDVIRLDRRVAVPLEVDIGAGATLCGAYLGLVDGRKAVQLTVLNETEEV